MQKTKVLREAILNLRLAANIIEKYLKDEKSLDAVWIAEGDILDAHAQVRQFLKGNKYKHTDILKVPRK